MRKPIKSIKPIQLCRKCPPVLDAALNPKNGAFRISVYGKISNLQDYDTKENLELLTAYLTMFLFMLFVASDDVSEVVEDIKNNCQQWF